MLNGMEPAGRLQGPRSLIVIEGIDGSGSTTQVRRVAEHLRQRGEPVFVTHEPSDGPVGMMIRLALAGRLAGPHKHFHDPSEIADDSGTELDPYTLALLFAADRADHVASQIQPNLARGRHVICDRYILSTLAYQGLTCDLDWLIEINRHIVRPDLTVFLDVPPNEAQKRMQSTRWIRDLYESPQQQLSIRDNYLALLDREISLVGPVVIIDATQPAVEVGNLLTAVLDTFLTSGKILEAKGELTLL
ncbi:MAG TPA: dTMP kinase [Longimicrobium sp.]|nr:dTMP kinase [Longimicrobium sp.]